ncbi:voltage-dependent anion channel [Infundibulicybe gibba]|nr:voltage-dependent anion channel [Infundibulicybe gibba]
MTQLRNMPPSRRKSLKDCIRNFTWAWHTVVMGTGVISALAARVATEAIALIFFFLNLSLFILICSATLWRVMLSHPSQSLFIGAFPMGATTLLNSALGANQQWAFGGKGFLYALWGLWWAVLVISLAITFGIFYIMMTRQQHSVNSMAAVWVLPIVTLVVASSTGGLLADALTPHSVSNAIFTTAVSLTVLMIGLTLATMMITVYLMRLVLYGPPDPSLVLSGFIVLGPFGQSGFSLLINGQNLATQLPLHMAGRFSDWSKAGEVMNVVCFCGAWVLWSMCIAWQIFAICSVYAVARKKPIPFSVAYWGTVFPNGVFALLTVQLGVVLDSPFFHYLGAILSVAVLILWLFIFIKTIPVVWNTSIFVAPYVVNVPPVTTSQQPGLMPQNLMSPFHNLNSPRTTDTA